MEVMELPLELLHIILFYSALGRGVKRALRLRLVCKRFAGAMYPALFETHMMDHICGNPIGSDSWQIRNQYGADKLWHDYLVYRVMNERDATVGRFVEIRQTAQAICQETESVLDLHAIVEALCWLPLKHGTKNECRGGREFNKWWGPMMKKSEQRANLGLNTLLSAAAYFDLLPLAKRLVAEGHSPTSDNYLFAPPIQVAAQAGNVTMLQFFQEQLPESNFEPLSVTGAAIRGDIAVGKLALRLPAATEQREGDSNDMNHQQFGSVEYSSKIGREILRARSYTSSPEVYDYLTSSLAPWPSAVSNAYNDLINYAELGKMSMVRHLLHLGVPVQMSGSLESPLAMACRGSQNDIVDLLLEHGADPNYTARKMYPFFPLHQSATAGNLSLARKLLDWGALPNRPASRPIESFPVLWWAFAREHTDMVQLLMERGASLDVGMDGAIERAWVGKSLVDMTNYLGYHSMVDILRQHDFELSDPPSITSFRLWYRWTEAKAIASGL